MTKTHTNKNHNINDECSSNSTKLKQMLPDGILDGQATLAQVGPILGIICGKEALELMAPHQQQCLASQHQIHGLCLLRTLLGKFGGLNAMKAFNQVGTHNNGLF